MKDEGRGKREEGRGRRDNEGRRKKASAFPFTAKTGRKKQEEIRNKQGIGWKLTDDEMLVIRN
jgi:hypothetical protein